MSSLRDLVTRCEHNPILTPAHVPGSDAVFNCGATKSGDTTILLVSVSSPTGPGCGKTMHVARSDDGVHFTVNPEPFISPADEGPHTQWDYDACDPRITYLDGTYYVTYPAHMPGQGVIGVLGKTADFETFERLEVIALPSNRVPVLFPDKVGGEYVRLDRPFGIYNGSLWLSYSKDLVYWGRHRALLSGGEKVWNNFKVGPGGPPIKTDAGWLVIYHAVSGPKIAATAYVLSVMLLDLADPTKIIGLPDDYLIGPEAPYERAGRVPNVVFTCGHVVDPDGELKLYYGAADTSIALATANVDALVEACLNART